MNELPVDGSADVCVAESVPFALTKRADAPPIGDELDALVAFRAAATRMKTADVELRAAQQEYASAIKQLSEASTR